jgi:hypothetical protein
MFFSFFPGFEMLSVTAQGSGTIQQPAGSPCRGGNNHVPIPWEALPDPDGFVKISMSGFCKGRSLKPGPSRYIFYNRQKGIRMLRAFFDSLGNPM